MNNQKFLAYSHFLKENTKSKIKIINFDSDDYKVGRIIRNECFSVLGKLQGRNDIEQTPKYRRIIKRASRLIKKTKQKNNNPAICLKSYYSLKSDVNDLLNSKPKNEDVTKIVADWVNTLTSILEIKIELDERPSCKKYLLLLKSTAANLTRTIEKISNKHSIEAANYAFEICSALYKTILGVLSANTIFESNKDLDRAVALASNWKNGTDLLQKKPSEFSLLSINDAYLELCKLTTKNKNNKNLLFHKQNLSTIIDSLKNSVLDKKIFTLINESIDVYKNYLKDDINEKLQAKLETLYQEKQLYINKANDIKSKIANGQLSKHDTKVKETVKEINFKLHSINDQTNIISNNISDNNLIKNRQQKVLIILENIQFYLDYCKEKTYFHEIMQYLDIEFFNHLALGELENIEISSMKNLYDLEDKIKGILEINDDLDEVLNEKIKKSQETEETIDVFAELDELLNNQSNNETDIINQPSGEKEPSSEENKGKIDYRNN